MLYRGFLFEIFSSLPLALTMGKEYNEVRWFGGQGKLGRENDILP